ncbi:C2H2-type zinc finger transcription factor [Rhizophagus clarus]|uniref:C2H2-type zinc finger transcription factor n=1 Tax=Rhizophagus clarus TaxID=94130 RepID=A0A8H3MC70_9GLOM|nr:C2H2-type zinc finger transcription factor [Rhizophagus clarus]
MINLLPDTKSQVLIIQAAATSQYQTQPFVYDQSTGTDGSKASTLQQNPASSMIPSTTAANLSPDSSNVLPPLSEVFSSPSSAQSPNQSQVQNVQQVQNQQVAAAAAAAAQNGFYYSDAAAAASYAAESNYGNAPSSLMSQAQQQSLGQQAAQSQIATNIPTLPRIGSADLQAQMLARRDSNALLAINTGMLGASDQSPISAGSSATSPIVYQQAAHQALLNSHFMAATQSMNGGIIPSSQRTINGHRKGFRTDDGDLTAATGDRPQKVYSFVALPGINTKKRPRRRYDEIERHYACNYPGCTKSYGTLNHLNAHVQMQKHGQKRHPSEFKELRKQWRRQKREEEERKAAEAAANKNTVGLNISSLSSSI